MNIKSKTIRRLAMIGKRAEDVFASSAISLLHDYCTAILSRLSNHADE